CPVTCTPIAYGSASPSAHAALSSVFFSTIRRPPRPTPFPTRRSSDLGLNNTATNAIINSSRVPPYYYYNMQASNGQYLVNNVLKDRKSTRLNSSHVSISYAVFCLKKKMKISDRPDIRMILFLDVRQVT